MTTRTSETRLGPPLASAASLPDRTPAFIAAITDFTLAATDHWLAVTAAERYRRDQAESTLTQPTDEVKGEEVAA